MRRYIECCLLYFRGMQKRLPKKFQNVERDLQVKRSSAGLGLYTNAPIEKDGFIIEYFGKIMTKRESDEKGGKYMFQTSENRIIDGSQRDNMARYINHSCRPNAEVEIRQGRLFVFAKRAIRKGEEIVYDYGKEYFDDLIKPYGCKCISCS